MNEQSQAGNNQADVEIEEIPVSVDISSSMISNRIPSVSSYPMSPLPSSSQASSRRRLRGPEQFRNQIGEQRSSASQVGPNQSSSNKVLGEEPPPPLDVSSFPEVGVLPEKAHLLKQQSEAAISPKKTLKQQLTKIFRKNQDSESDEEIEAETGCRSFILSTSNLWYQVWKFSNIILSLVSACDYAYFAAFKLWMTDRQEVIFLVKHGFYSLFFLFGMVLTFFTERTSSLRVERKPLKIACAYLQGQFLLDLVALLPLELILINVVPEEYIHLVFLVKVIRLFVGLKLLDPKFFISHLKKMVLLRVQKMIEESDQFELDPTQDHIHITRILLLSYLLRAVQMVVYLLCGSFFMGLFWFIYCTYSGDEELSFIGGFELRDRTPLDLMQLLTYFAFTSLSTVGLGDFHPLTSDERLLCAFLLLFGVAFNTMVIENLMQMVLSINALRKDFEESRKLSHFIGTMERFNHSKPLDPKLVSSIEQYFEYRWKYNNNNAISTEEDIALLVQLPSVVQTQIYSDYLFKEYLAIYKKYLTNHLLYEQIKKGNQRKSSSKITFTKIVDQSMDESSMQFQIAMLKALEPKFYALDEVFISEDESVVDITFILNGLFEVGYSIDRYFEVHEAMLNEIKMQAAPPRTLSRSMTMRSAKPVGAIKQVFNKYLQAKKSTMVFDQYAYPCSFKAGQAIGMYEMCYYQKSAYRYRPKKWIKKGIKSKGCDAFFIRKANWVQVIGYPKKQTDIQEKFQRFILFDYIQRIHIPISEHQEGLLKKAQNEERIKHRRAIDARNRHIANVNAALGRNEQPLEEAKEEQKNSHDETNVQLLEEDVEDVDLSELDEQEQFDDLALNKNQAQGRIIRQQTKKFSAVQLIDRIRRQLSSKRVESKQSEPEEESKENHVEAGINKKTTNLLRRITWRSQVKDKNLKVFMKKLFTSKSAISSTNLSQIPAQQITAESTIKQAASIVESKVHYHEGVLTKMIRKYDWLLDEYARVVRESDEKSYIIQALQEENEELRAQQRELEHSLQAATPPMLPAEMPASRPKVPRISLKQCEDSTPKSYMNEATGSKQREVTPSSPVGSIQRSSIETKLCDLKLQVEETNLNTFREKDALKESVELAGIYQPPEPKKHLSQNIVIGSNYPTFVEQSGKQEGEMGTVSVIKEEQPSPDLGDANDIEEPPRKTSEIESQVDHKLSQIEEQKDSELVDEAQEDSQPNNSQNAERSRQSYPQKQGSQGFPTSDGQRATSKGERSTPARLFEMPEQAGPTNPEEKNELESPSLPIFEPRPNQEEANQNPTDLEEVQVDFGAVSSEIDKGIVISQKEIEEASESPHTPNQHTTHQHEGSASGSIRQGASIIKATPLDQGNSGGTSRPDSGEKPAPVVNPFTGSTFEQNELLNVGNSGDTPAMLKQETAHLGGQQSEGMSEAFGQTGFGNQPSQTPIQNQLLFGADPFEAEPSSLPGRAQPIEEPQEEQKVLDQGSSNENRTNFSGGFPPPENPNYSAFPPVGRAGQNAFNIQSVYDDFELFQPYDEIQLPGEPPPKKRKRSSLHKRDRAGMQRKKEEGSDSKPSSSAGNPHSNSFTSTNRGSKYLNRKEATLHSPSLHHSEERHSSEKERKQSSEAWSQRDKLGFYGQASEDSQPF